MQALFVDGQQVEQVAAGQDAVVILDQTPFYGESGGRGRYRHLTGQNAEFSVQDTQKYGKAFGHIGKLRRVSCGWAIACRRRSMKYVVRASSLTTQRRI